MIIVWITVASLICTIIYSLVMYGYMHNEAMWEECIFPGVVIWKKLDEANINVVGKVIVTTIASIALFTYTLIVCLGCIIALFGIGSWELFKYVFKRRR